MASPKRRTPMLPTRHNTTRTQQMSRKYSYLLPCLAFSTCVLLLTTLKLLYAKLPTTSTTSLFTTTDDARDIRLFIAIGSAPKNGALRSAARQGWLQWGDTTTIVYKFFTDPPPPPSSTLTRQEKAMWNSIALESQTYGDIITMENVESGYGDKEHNAYGQRALYQLHWAKTRAANLTHFLRLDDDAFLCLHKLMYELRSLPKLQFFWGRYWCRAGRNRADESFMLFTRDVVELLTSPYLGGLVPFDEGVTFGWNFGYLAWTLNLTAFDDHRRIDSQQGYLTEYMHGEGGGMGEQFCEKYIFAHHVKAAVMVETFRQTKTHLMYELPRITSPFETCAVDVQSFVPGRHSTRLPDVKIERVRMR